MTRSCHAALLATVAVAGCGGSMQTVERPPLIAIPREVPSFELIDVHVASADTSLDELAEQRRLALADIDAEFRRELGRRVAIHPHVEGVKPPIADPFVPCLAEGLASEQGQPWKLAIGISETTTDSNSLFAVFLDSKSYIVTVYFAVWDEDLRLVDREAITFTKDEQGEYRTHASAPPDDELHDDASNLMAWGKIGDPLWTRAVKAALPIYLARFRASRVKRFVPTNGAYSEPSHRTAFRAKHEERRAPQICRPG